MDYSLLLCIQENPEYLKLRKDLHGRVSSNITYNPETALYDNSLMMSRNSSVKEGLQEIRNNFEGSRHKFLSVCGRYIYHIGIIDYLQDYNFDKKLENLAKYHIMMKGPGISAVPPPKYAERFLNFMRSQLIIDQKQS